MVRPHSIHKTFRGRKRFYRVQKNAATRYFEGRSYPEPRKTTRGAVIGSEANRWPLARFWRGKSLFLLGLVALPKGLGQYANFPGVEITRYPKGLLTIGAAVINLFFKIVYEPMVISRFRYGSMDGAFNF
jgi:hypothetical protein